MYVRLARVFVAVASMVLGTSALGCAAEAFHDDEEASESNGTGDLSLGTVEGAAESWGDATKCKPIPSVEALKSPEIVISLDGLTLHLRDRAGTYDRVFPIGPGSIENGKSLTPIGQFYTGGNTTEVPDGKWGYYYSCRIMWTDSETGKASPVFAGLPFIRLAGAPTAGYAIHGPVDRFTAPNGGSLRRGYVSHGCIRMAAEDIVEVYARIRGRARTPVRIQQEAERVDIGGVSGVAVDVAQKWIGSECRATSDCNFQGGACRIPEGATVGTCTRPCTRTCPDRAGEATTFCVADPANGAGICVPQATVTFTDRCDRYPGRLALKAGASRPDRSARADVCAPLR